MWPEFGSKTSLTTVNILHGKGEGTKPKHKLQQGQQKGGSTKKEEQSRKKLCYSCGSEPTPQRSECPAKKAMCYRCGKEGHYSSVYRSKGKNVKVHEEQAWQGAAGKYQNCIPEEYTAVYFGADVNTLKTATVKSLNNPRPEPQIRPLQLRTELSSQIYNRDCEVNTTGSCNILPLYKVRTLFGENIQLGPPTVKLIGYITAQSDTLVPSWCFSTMAMRNKKSLK